jgi:activator of HSP90 ATPase
MTRRRLVVGLAGVAAAAQEPAAKPEAIHEELEFPVAPHRIYEALLDSKQFSAFSGVPAEINREAGGAFSLFGGQITGRNVELIPDRRIVQAWRPASWPEGVYSIARFELQAQGAGTRMVFDHTGFPPRLREHLASGWQEHYFGPLKKTFAQ